MVIREDCLTAVNAVHGGAHCALADLALVAASTSHGNPALVVNTDISFPKACGSLEISSVLYHQGHRSRAKQRRGFPLWGDSRVEKLKPNQDHFSQADIELHHTYPINP